MDRRHVLFMVSRDAVPKTKLEELEGFGPSHILTFPIQVICATGGVHRAQILQSTSAPGDPAEPFLAFVNAGTSDMEAILNLLRRITSTPPPR